MTDRESKILAREKDINRVSYDCFVDARESETERRQQEEEGEGRETAQSVAPWPGYQRAISETICRAARTCCVARATRRAS